MADRWIRHFASFILYTDNTHYWQSILEYCVNVHFPRQESGSCSFNIQ